MKDFDKKQIEFKDELKSYKKELSQCKLHELLLAISLKSIQLFKNKPMILEKFPMVNSIKNELVYRENWITAWDLVDLSYDAVCYSTDIKGHHVHNLSEISHFATRCRDVREKYAESHHNIKKLNQDELYLYIFSFAGEQAKFQIGTRVKIHNLLRDLYIIFEIGQNKHGFKAEEAIIKEVGCDFITALGCLFMLFGFSFFNPLISNAINIFPWDNDKIKSTFCSFIERYSCTYEEVRNSKLKRQIFYTKPFIYTQQGHKLISVNCYLSLFTLEHGIYWIIRDYFNKIGSTEFVNKFGEYFEFYVEELLNEYVADKSNFHKIHSVPNEKRCDWCINLFGKTFLIEQKSTLAKLSIKQQDTDFNGSISFVKSTLGEAIAQLNSTENYINKKCYKIILIYEDYFVSSLSRLNSKFNFLGDTNDTTCWIATISEFETILHLYKHNKVLCEKIIDEKINRENETKKGDCSFSAIFRDNKIIGNYFGDSKFRKYKKLFDSSIKVFNKELVNNYE